MTMNDKLALILCDSLQEEALHILKQERFDHVDAFFYNPDCYGPKISKGNIDRILGSILENSHYGRVEVFHSDLCFRSSVLDYPKEKVNFQTADLCFKFLINEKFIRQLIDEASYILTPSFLKRWKQVINKKWQFDRTGAIDFFHESTKKIVFLDTKTSNNLTKELIALSEYIKMPYEVLSVGTDYLKLKIQKVYQDWLNDKERKEYHQKLAKTAASLADFQMSFDFLKNISQSFNEKDIIHNTFEIFNVLFRPANLFFLSLRYRGRNKLHFKNFRGLISESDEKKAYEQLKDFYAQNKKDTGKSYCMTEDRKGFILKITHKEDVLGVFMLQEAFMQEYLKKYINHALSLVTVLGLAISNARSFSELNDMKDKYRFLSFHDSPTGLYNRTYFDEEMKRISNDLERFKPVTLISADINNLKETNDAMGHLKGDKLIKESVKILASSIRKTDILARIGGDEFCAILPKTSLSLAAERFEKIKVLTDRYNQQSKDIKISISIGMYGTEKDQTADLYEIFRKSDEMMYINKKIMKAKEASQKKTSLR